MVMNDKLGLATVVDTFNTRTFHTVKDGEVVLGGMYSIVFVTSGTRNDVHNVLSVWVVTGDGKAVLYGAFA